VFSVGESITPDSEPVRIESSIPQQRRISSANRLQQKELPEEEQFAAQALLQDW
jgi:hypothetical protein